MSILSKNAKQATRLTRLITGCCLVCLTLNLGGCTTTTTVRPNAPALVDDGDAAEQGEHLRNMALPDLLRTGNALLIEGKAALARLYFVAAVGREPQSAPAFAGLGDAYFQLGDYKAALTSYKNATTLDPQCLSAILGQAQILREQGDLNSAQELLTRANDISPNNIKVLTEQAVIYNIQGKAELAAPLLKEIAEKAPDSAATFNNIGINELSRGNYALAIVNLSKAYLLDGKNPTTSNNLATAYALYGQESQALALFKKTVGEAAAWNNIGYLYMTKNRFDDAERALRKAQETSPKFYEKAQENLDRLQVLRRNSIPKTKAPPLAPDRSQKK